MTRPLARPAAAIGHRGFSAAGGDGLNLAAFDDDLAIAQGAALAIEQKGGIEDDAVLGGG